MSKNPKWFDTTPEHVCHPSQTLRLAVMVLRENARAYRRYHNKDGARVLDMVADALEAVAAGATWSDAFGMH